MRSIKKSLWLLTFLPSVVCATGIPVNKDALYINEPSMTIEYQEGKTRLYAEERSVKLIIDNLFTVADKLALVATVKKHDIPALSIANERLHRLEKQLIKQGVPSDRIASYIVRKQSNIESIDVFVFPHSWEGLSSALIQKHIDEKPGTLVYEDTPRGLKGRTIGSWIISDRLASEELKALIEALGWKSLNHETLAELEFTIPKEYTFLAVYLPAGDTFVLDLLNQIFDESEILSNFKFKLFPEKKEVVIYEEIEQ